MTDLGPILALTRIVGLVLTGVFAGYALLVRFKDDAGRVTKSGRTALVLIAASTLVALGSQTIEFIRDTREQERRNRETYYMLRRTERMLFDIERSLQPITVRVSFDIAVPTNDAHLRGYLERFRKALKKRRALVGNQWLSAGATALVLEAGNVIRFGFDGGSPFAPMREREELAYNVLGYAYLDITFYKKHIVPWEHPLSIVDLNKRLPLYLSNQPDLEVSVETGFEGCRDSHMVLYQLEPSQFWLKGILVPTVPQSLSGKIEGIPDLVGVQMFVSLRDPRKSNSLEVEEYELDVRRRFELDALSLEISAQGRKMDLGRDDLERHVDANGYPLYVFTFPDTLERVEALFRLGRIVEEAEHSVSQP